MVVGVVGVLLRPIAIDARGYAVVVAVVFGIVELRPCVNDFGGFCPRLKEPQSFLMCFRLLVYVFVKSCSCCLITLGFFLIFLAVCLVFSWWLKVESRFYVVCAG